VGERLITGATSDYSEETLALLGAVYKIAAVEENGEFSPRIKISGAVEKITNPGLKKVYRIYDKTGKAKADLIAMADEQIDMTNDFKFIDPTTPWKKLWFSNCTAKPLQVKIFEKGKLVYNLPSLQEIKDFVKDQLDNEIWEEEQRFVNPHVHYMDMTPDYYNMKMNLLNEKR
jgi:nicotinate phosphoribosyltransferase